MKESSQPYKTISNRLKEDNDMSSVPLMTLHNSKRGGDDVHDSDQMTDEDDPLESVLARMKYRPQNYRSQDFWTSLMFSGVTCFVIGFVVSYVLFLSIDQNNKLVQTIEHDANPQIASTLLQELSGRSIGKFVGVLSISSRNESRNRALKIRQHFLNLGFDSVSPITPTDVTFSYYDKNKPNLVTVVDENAYNVDDNGRLLHGTTDDSYSSDSDMQGFHVSTDVKGTVVYVNFGRESDFKFLEKSNVVVKKAIILARLGKVSPVELVQRCLHKGAAGVILFADPQQYPDIKKRNKPFLSPSQLGLLQVMHGNAATEGSNNTSCVPVQTLSAEDAEFILNEMSANDPSPDSWRGNLKVNYQIGPGFSTTGWELRIQVNMINVRKTYYSVVGAIRGSHEPDRYVLLGSSHGSVSGDDTVGAAASMMEMARAFNVLNANQGWRPRRSIVFCSWGFNFMQGSASSVPLSEDWGYIMREKAVAYLGVDVAVRGNRTLSVAATPLLSKAVFDASSLVPNPATRSPKEGLVTVYDTWIKTSPSLFNTKIPQINNVKGEGNFQTFLYDLGIPSIDLHYASTKNDDGGFVDDDFRYHRAIAQVWAMLTWLLADSLMVPFDIKQYATFLSQSVNSVSLQYEKEIKSNALPLLQLEDAIHNFTIAAEAFQKKTLLVDKSKPLAMRIMNDQQLRLERAFLHHHGTHMSPPPRHAVFSPVESISVNSTVGFATLQNLMDDLSASPLSALVRTQVEAHLESLVHCISSATHGLGIPIQPPVL
ncbi:N-acetylated-alpha-linked acidic dipeptidase 2-like [Periplaneta americana]|uniref:N-acetylated-alpha-linked acidic dipeptidase 2-like n=1 Tax=Periplaneta americana TaxID=6978 RepID=UPI0037E9B13F